MKRFYREVGTQPLAGGWRVTLDGRPVKTVGHQPQIVPTLALADALAAEWAQQSEVLDASRFILRDMADYAIDVVQTRRDEVERAVLAFAESDTLCYRGDPDEPLWAHQHRQWEPLLTAAERRWEVQFRRISGIIHQLQAPATLARLALVVAAHDDFTLAALQTLTSLAASLVVGLAALEPSADIAALWATAHVEEEWQADLWGRDDEAEALRAQRGVVFEAAARLVRLLQAKDQKGGGFLGPSPQTPEISKYVLQTRSIE